MSKRLSKRANISGDLKWLPISRSRANATGREATVQQASHLAACFSLRIRIANNRSIAHALDPWNGAISQVDELNVVFQAKLVEHPGSVFSGRFHANFEVRRDALDGASL
jgi:hypothetical protein